MVLKCCAFYWDQAICINCCCLCNFRYVYQCIDEVTKNHQIDESHAKGRMYDAPESDMCPVKTFELYISKLHPSSDLFFQLPRRCYNVSDDLWLEPKPIGENTLGNFMPRISAMCSLSRRYTNHCLRSTAITLLDEAQFPSRHIMTVSGHKSENSIKSYNHHTNEETKRLMSHTLTRRLGIDTDSAIVETAAASQPVSVSAPRSPLMAITGTAFVWFAGRSRYSGWDSGWCPSDRSCYASSLFTEYLSTDHAESYPMWPTNTCQHCKHSLSLSSKVNKLWKVLNLAEHCEFNCDLNIYEHYYFSQWYLLEEDLDILN